MNNNQNQDIQINLFGSLREMMKDRSGPPIRLNLEKPAQLAEVLKRLEIPSDRVQLAMVNYRAVPRGSMIKPGDRLSLFPREYPVFADWNDLRFKEDH